MKEVLITSSVLVAALLLLRVVFAKKVRRTWIYAAWLLVALRLLIPVQIGQMSFSVLHAMQSVTTGLTQMANTEIAGITEEEAYQQVLRDYVEEDTSVFVPAIQDEIASNMASGMSKEEIAERIEENHPDGDIYVPEAQQQVQQKVEKAVAPVTLGQIATWVWLVGVAIMVIWLATGNLLLGRALRKTEKMVDCDSPLPVYVSDAAISPCLVGLFRPAVYLTPECGSDETVLRHVLAHELTHYGHKDHIWALVRCICLCVYWFNPLVWVAAWFSRRDCELACDEGAIKRLGEENRIAYGKALLQVVSHSAVPGRLMLTATTMAETKKQLRQRVNFITNRTKWSAVAAVAMLLICALLVGCVVTGPVSEPAEPTYPPLKRPWDVSEEVKLQIKQDYIEPFHNTTHTCTAEDVQLVMISQVESGYALVIGCKCTSINLKASWEDLFGASAADLVFYMPNGWYLQFYKDSTFSSLDGAYNLGWLDYEQMCTIWDDYHAQFPRAKKVWEHVFGQSEPPDRDPSGLDYEVNADGVTCTVTGMGVGNNWDVVIPEYIDGYQVTAIGKLAFWSTWVTSITMPDSVISIGYSAFEECDKLKSITLSNSLQTIGSNVFKDCKTLEVIQLPDSLTQIGPGAFSGCSALTAMTIPAGVSVVPSWAFADCSDLQVLLLHEGIVEIQEYAFYHCMKMPKLEIPEGLVEIADGTFMGCMSLKSIRIPQTVTSIGDDAFADCRALQTVEIPDQVQYVGRNAFWGCSGLTALSIGKSVRGLDSSVFENCSNLCEIEVSADNPDYRASGGCLIEIQSGTLMLASGNAAIPTDGSVRHIGQGAFQGRTNLQELVLPEGIETIGNDAFKNCTNLAQITIPETVRLIEPAFDACRNLKNIIYSGTKAQWRAIRKGTYIGDGSCSFTVYCTDGELIAK